MRELSISLPDDLRKAISEAASRHSLTESAWIEEAVRCKLEADAQMAYLMSRAARADRAAYDQILADVPAATPDSGDNLPATSLSHD